MLESTVQFVTPAASLTGQFDETALVIGALLVAGALLAGIAHRSFLSMTAVFVLVGFVLGQGGLGVLEFNTRSTFVDDLAVVALIVILFRDGLEVDAEMLQKAWHVPLRALVLAMPLTAIIIAGAAKLLTDLNWTEAFLLGALLSPTDPVLSSSVVTNPRVPRLIRHSLNLESGMNDGLALPAVIAFSAALESGHGDFVWWEFVLQDVTLGLVFGIGMGLLASFLLPRSSGLRAGLTSHQKALFALGVAAATYGVTAIEPHGNAFIGVFTCAITLGIRRPDVRAAFEQRAEDIIEVVKLMIFVVFGSLLTLDGLFGDGWAAVAIVVVTLLVARPVALFAALARTGLDTPTKAFMAWFGPKGVATMTFSLLVLSKQIPNGERIFNLAALVVFASIIAHGLTDTPGANWIARRAEARERGSPSAGGEPSAVPAS
ncbi:MAG TPA: cation:proton antiporter [Solirubrobacteraceae bacterium]|nr:cation:proton antiporter [Solirubrobacteraceae bacterium]